MTESIRAAALAVAYTAAGAVVGAGIVANAIVGRAVTHRRSADTEIARLERENVRLCRLLGQGIDVLDTYDTYDSWGVLPPIGMTLGDVMRQALTSTPEERESTP